MIWKNLTPLQKSIISLLSDHEFKTASDIAWELKKNQMHIGTSLKSLMKKGIVNDYHSDYSNVKYYLYQETQNVNI